MSADEDMGMLLLHPGVPLAVVVTPTDPGRYAWIGVYPLDVNRPGTVSVMRRLGVPVPTEPASLYRVRHFEAAREPVDADRWLGPDDLIILADVIAVGDDELPGILRRLGSSVGELRQHWKSNYPI